MKVVMMRFIVIGIAIMASMISVVSAQTITAMPLLFGRQANNDLYNCDGLSKCMEPFNALLNYHY